MCNMVVIGVVTRQWGVDSYALYAFGAAWLVALPFADLGLGAGVVNVLSDARAGKIGPAAAMASVRRAVILLSFSGAAISILGVSAYRLGFFTSVLGAAAIVNGAEIALLVTICFIGFALPLGLGMRLLQAMSRSREAAWIGLASPITTLCCAAALAGVGVKSWVVACVPGFAALLVALLTSMRARRVLRAEFGETERSAPAPELWRSAAPFFVLTIGTALGSQSHRIVASYVGDASSLAAFAFVAQIVGPAVSVASFGAQSLWPGYRIALAAGELRGRTLARHVGVFAGYGVSAGCAVVVGVPWLAGSVSGGALVVDLGLALAAGAYLTAFCAFQPIGMLMTDRRGLWLQAAVIVTAGLLSVPAMYILGKEIGAAGVYVGAFAGLVMVLWPVTTSIGLRWYIPKK
ncbi:hypothetical protein [Actinotalea sp. JY-7885]|uniref:hypothetical protein n=1 Tax=Actinotalea sp. JY-7885 TaxID=2758576 RepID=UPI00165E4659|nr:hypothetical protein [Actinotalea sp. JY-7885]